MAVLVPKSALSVWKILGNRALSLPFIQQLQLTKRRKKHILKPVIDMENKEKLKELASRAKGRLTRMGTPKTEEDARNENQEFAFLEQQLYKEMTQGDMKWN